MKKKKFWEFKNVNKNEKDFYLYGEIVSGSNEWKFDESDVTFQDIRDALEDMDKTQILNIYVNSPGGSVITSQGIVSMIMRAKDRGVKVNAYIDGIGASCSSWIPMIADNIYIYNQSILMIHKPMGAIFGNADEMKKQIEILDKIENEVIIPLYMKRVKDGVTEDDIRNYMRKETWFTSNEIMDVFDGITLLENKKDIACCVDKNIMENYINIPDNIKDLIIKEDNNLDKFKNESDENLENSDEVNNEPDKETTQEHDKEAINDTETDKNKEDDEINDSKTDENKESLQNDDSKEAPVPEKLVEKNNSEEEEEEILQRKLNTSNKTIIDLNEKVVELENKIKDLQVIADKYNAIIEKENKQNLDNKIKENYNTYKIRFENIHQSEKFESEEIQNLLNNYSNENVSKINEIIVNLISENLEIKNEKKERDFGDIKNLNNENKNLDLNNDNLYSLFEE